MVEVHLLEHVDVEFQVWLARENYFEKLYHLVLGYLFVLVNIHGFENLTKLPNGKVDLRLS